MPRLNTSMLGGLVDRMALSAGLTVVLLLVTLHRTNATVILMSGNTSLLFPSKEANFVPQVHGSAICGYLFSGEPSNACTKLKFNAKSFKGSCSPFLLATRGNCSFETKVRHAQDADFTAVIIYNNEESAELLTMAGNPQGILIHAVFVSKEAGEALLQYTDDLSAECWVLPTFRNMAWSIAIFAVISLLAVAASLVTCFIVRRRRNLHFVSRLARAQEPSYGISPQLVKALPSVIFKTSTDGNVSEVTCAICLEDYIIGDRLRILPCCHKFHSSCIDSWLTTWRSFCPICKWDASLECSEPSASENTPLLRSSVSCQGPIMPSVGSVMQLSSPELHSVLIPSQSLGSDVGSSNRLPPLAASSSNTSPMLTPYASRHSPLLCLGSRAGSLFSNLDPDSIEAFRASPYFTPPSLSRPGSYLSTHNVVSYLGTPYATSSLTYASNGGSPSSPSAYLQ
eukprot:c22586_g1_i1 orf=470-1834(-)